MKPYDPKLREAAEELKTICEKYDIAAACLLVSPSHSEFVNKIDPSWSVARLEGPNGIRFRSKREDFKSQEEQKHANLSTAHMLTSFVEWSRITNKNMLGVLEHLKTKMTVLWETWSDHPDSYPGDGK